MINESPLTFTVADQVLDLGWNAVGFAMTHLQNKEFDPGFEQLQAETLPKILAGITAEQLQSDPILRGFKQLHQAIAHSNRETIAAPETLLNILLKAGTPPHINLLVDIYNLVSMETRLALGAHDLSKITGNVQMRLMDGTENFWPIGSAGPKKIRPGDYAYIDDNQDILCWLEVKQVEKTKVTAKTTDCFYIIQGNSATSAEYLKNAATRLINLTKRFCGGQEYLIYTPVVSRAADLAAVRSQS
jgi:DNA/RNA-binding domain of Phe-tRNA-synthetase-like protein